MGLKNFDYKQLLIDRGERIGLGAAGVITLFLTASLFFPGMGFMSGSASGNANALANVTKTVETGLVNDKPTDNWVAKEDKPGDTKDKLTAFQFDIMGPDKTKQYAINELFLGEGPSIASRQMPDLLQPTDSRAAVARLQIASFVFDSPDLKRVLVLDNAGKTSSGPGVSPGGSSGGPSNKQVGAFIGAASALPVSGRSRSRRKVFHGDGSDQEDLKSHFVDTAKIASITDQKLAEVALPVRAAEIVAAFPYKAQVQEFRDKLGLARDEQVLAEQSQEMDPKTKQPLPAFRFLGVRLERRQVDAQGNPLDALGKPVDAKGGWAEVNLEESYGNLMLQNGKRFEEEDPKVLPVELDRTLVMRKLLTFGDRRVPPVEEYPKLEEKVPELATTIETLNKNPDTVVVAPSLINRNFSIFDADVGTTAQTQPGGSAKSPIGMAAPGGSSSRIFNPSFGPTPGGSGPTSGGPSNRGSFGAGVLQAGQSFTIPDYCLIRLFDVTIEPGKTYEYRMQVHMGNPNRDRTDAGSQRWAHLDELPAKDWYVLPEKVKVPLDVNYYAVDQAKLDAAAPKEAKDPNQPREVKPPLQAVKENQTVLQIQKWVETLKTKRGEQPIGDWVIADRVVATRGEAIGPQKVEVPYWRDTQERFTLLSDNPPKSARKGPPMVEVPFMEGEEPIVVDFTGGSATYKRTRSDATVGQAAPVTDANTAVDVLMLMPDGTLAAHDSGVDAADPQRISRLKADREWIREVKNSKGPGTNQSTPFGMP